MGSIELAQVHDVRLDSTQPSALEVAVTSGRTYHLTCSSPGDAAQWMAAIAEARRTLEQNFPHLRHGSSVAELRQ